MRPLQRRLHAKARHLERQNAALVAIINALLAGWDGMDSIDYLDEEYEPALAVMEKAVADARASLARQGERG